MRIVHLALVLVAGLFVQWAWSTYGSVWDLAPQILLILAIALAAREGPIVSLTFAFVWGVFFDVLRVHLFGAQALLFTCVAYAVGLVRRQIDVSSLLPQAMLLAAISFLYYPALALAGLIFEGHGYWVGWKQFLLTPFFNCAVAAPCFLFVERFTQKHDY